MPRTGPRKPVLAVRVGVDVMEWLRERSDRTSVPFPDFARRALTYARHHMPEDWEPPEGTP